MGQKYYTRAKHKECIVEMQELTDSIAVFNFCVLNMYKYAYRAGLKTKNSDSDLNKLVWYRDYAHGILGNIPWYKRTVYIRRYNKVCSACADLLK